LSSFVFASKQIDPQNHTNLKTKLHEMFLYLFRVISWIMCRLFYGLVISWDADPGAHAPGYMLPPASQAGRLQKSLTASKAAT